MADEYRVPLDLYPEKDTSLMYYSIHNLNLIMRKHRPNPKCGMFYKGRKGKDAPVPYKNNVMRDKKKKGGGLKN